MRISGLGALALLAALACGGCAGVDPAQRSAHAQRLAAAAGWTRLTLAAGQFELTAYVPASAGATAAPSAAVPQLTVYIEGDGLAWTTPHTPSADPTPLNPVALQLALKHPDRAVAYLARPCQYRDPAHGGACPSDYWTAARYAPEVIAATSLAIDQLKLRAGAGKVTLIGYSGGGAVAALVAARRDDVAGLVTLAANLDTAEWAKLQQLQPLSRSLNPADAWPRLQSLPQRHYAGADDKVVDPRVQQAYAAHFPAARRPLVIVVPGADHACCWVARWPALLLSADAPAQAAPAIPPD